MKVYPRIAPAFWHYLRVEEHEQLTYSSTRSKAPSVIITGLKPATKYIFHIRVRTAAGYSGYSQKFEFETGDETSDMAAEQGQILVIATAAVGGFTLLVILTLFFLITGRCQWYIKAKMKSEEKRRKDLQNGHLRFPGIKTYIDPDTYEDPSLAIHEFAKEIDPSRIRIERVIGAGEFGEVCSGRLKTPGKREIPVAIKTLKGGHMDRQRRDFLREASIMGQFDHPNIIRLEGVVTKNKRKAAGEPIKEGDNDYFTCITKAYEMLSDPVKRRAFNSVDPTFDNSVPSKSEAKDNFFEVFSPVFERNSRKRKKPRKKQKRKQKQTQNKRSKRLKRNRQAELEAARLAKEKEEEEVRQQALLAKKEKDIQKKAIKKERQKLRNSCKTWNHFSDSEAEHVKMMEEVEKLCDRLELASLQCLNETLTSSTKEVGKAALEKQIEEINEQIRKEKEEAEARMRQASKNAEKSAGGGGNGSKHWSEDDLQLLIKAVNLFPAGTNSRWEVIANYMNIHSSSGVNRTAKDVIGKAKSLQKLDPHQKDDINKKAFDKFKKEHGVVPQADNATPSERFEGPCTDFTPWTTEEQKLLEQALKTYPVNTPERWEKIAEAVPGRTKKDCMKRYKELVEMVKAKKAAQEQVLNASRGKK
ncbi:hypothetical protein MJG53_001141 [Ovis ammon polii x Ovis aries]|uniref:Uncharacterized protein n=1 Tax=Ovis ammon polii x Ovis aries TaxID=2918886 RepID=A0ACB9VK61_9CETA|nr:hypothetical protein MJG53_001141 [Ovis ammon polii x Ovis aries]